jgi:hypothetical protein
MLRLQRYLHDALATLLQIDPTQRIGILLIILVFLIALNLSSNVIYTTFANQLWGNLLMLLSPVVTIAIAVVWLARLARQRSRPQEPRLAKPAPHVGLVWMLSIFSVRATGPDGAPLTYRIDELRTALDAPQVDHAAIKAMVEAPSSNLRPLLAAIRHHSASDTLKHLWLLATDDLANPFGNEPIQSGSRHLAPLVRRLLHEIYLFNHLNIHDDDPQFVVHPHVVVDTYRAVAHIFQQDAPRLGLAPSEVLADVTGGRVPMSCGMILACAPNDWHMQFTSTDFDPATNSRPEQPLPMQISVDLRTVLRQTLEATGRQLN